MVRTRRFFASLSLFASLAIAPLGGFVVPSSPVATTEIVSVPVSATNPLASCPADGSGTLYTNAEVEPWVAVNPANGSNIVGAWQQDRWSTGASRGGVAGYSFDGGKSWTEVALPFTSCVAGGLPYVRASDLWVSIGPDGTAYASAIGLTQSGGSAVVAAVSTDGGKSWTNAREVIADPDPNQFFDDKSSVTADPKTPGLAYVVWDRLASGNGESESGSRAGAPNAPAYFSKTEDGGKTWSEPRAITGAEPGEATGNQIVVDPRTGTLYDFFDMISQPNRGRLSYSVQFVKSVDGGATWSEPSTVSDLRAAPVSVPNSRTTVRAGGLVPEVAIDPTSGKLYAVWMDSRFGSGRYPEVVISSSDDGGGTWSPPARVSTPTGGAAFTPSIAVDSAGVVAVTYYDFRGLAAGAVSLPTDCWATFSSDGGASFAGEAHLAGPFDILTAPNSSGYFLGDYQSLAPTGDGFMAFFVQANSGDESNRTDVRAAVLVPPVLAK